MNFFISVFIHKWWYFEVMTLNCPVLPSPTFLELNVANNLLEVIVFQTVAPPRFISLCVHVVP